MGRSPMLDVPVVYNAEWLVLRSLGGVGGDRTYVEVVDFTSGGLFALSEAEDEGSGCARVEAGGRVDYN
jgi:hypothetical protein